MILILSPPRSVRDGHGGKRIALDPAVQSWTCGTPAPPVPDGVRSGRRSRRDIKAVPDDPASGAIDTCDWLRRVAVVVPDSVKAWDLGRGESEVIAHALVSPGFRPLLDDSEGKACSLAFGLKPLGTGGLLVYAKRSGLLDSVGDVLDDMRGRGLWISDQVFNAILQQAGEKTNDGKERVKS